MDQDAAPVRPTSSRLLRELDLQLESAADALSRQVPDADQARACVGRARQALAQLVAQQEADGDGDDRRAEPTPWRWSAASSSPPSAPPPARRGRSPVQTCDRWALPTSVRNAAVDIASELVSNAAAHGTGPVVLAIERGAGNLLVRAWDDGPGTPRVLPYRPGVSDKGLGLRLVKQLSTHWGAAVDDGGKWVWARIALPEHDDG